VPSRRRLVGHGHGHRPGRRAHRAGAMAGPAMKARRADAGVTLVELVVVLTIIGLVVSIGATLVTRVVGRPAGQPRPPDAGDVGRRCAGPGGRRAASALPNSLRVSASGMAKPGSSSCRCSTPAATAPPPTPSAPRRATRSTWKTPATTASTSSAPPIGSAPAGSQLVLHNLGSPRPTPTPATTGAAAWCWQRRPPRGLHARGALPPSTGTQRFFVVGTPVTLACQASGGGFELRRYSGYGWLASQPDERRHAVRRHLDPAARRTGSCSAAYSTALANIGLLNLRLGLADREQRAHGIPAADRAWTTRHECLHSPPCPWHRPAGDDLPAGRRRPDAVGRACCC
jgi:MSHA biogenesis protein MshO